MSSGSRTATGPGTTVNTPVRAVGTPGVLAATAPVPARVAWNVVDEPDVDIVSDADIPWIVIVWNDPINLMSYVTLVLQKLFGERIRIRGFMFPTFKRKGIDRFVLVRDNQECCFGPGAAIYDGIRVTLKEGEAVEYSHTPVAVEGDFKLEEYFLDDERTVGTVFHLDSAVVQ